LGKFNDGKIQFMQLSVSIYWVFYETLFHRQTLVKKKTRLKIFVIIENICLQWRIKTNFIYQYILVIMQKSWQCWYGSIIIPLTITLFF
jgi:hypothetical protein